MRLGAVAEDVHIAPRQHGAAAWRALRVHDMRLVEARAALREGVQVWGDVAGNRVVVPVSISAMALRPERIREDENEVEWLWAAPGDHAACALAVCWGGAGHGREQVAAERRRVLHVLCPGGIRPALEVLLTERAAGAGVGNEHCADDVRCV